MTTLPRLLRPSPTLRYAKRGRPRRDDPRYVKNTAPLNNLARELEKYGKKAVKYPQSYGPFKRINVVDEELCDYTINSIASSLEHFRGCDVLDIFPGPGLWSKKIHDFLQPRRHTLVDVNQDRFEPFLRDLIEQPNSRYHFKGVDWHAKIGRRDAYTQETIAGALGDASADQHPLLVLATMTILRGTGTGKARNTAEEGSGEWKRNVNFVEYVPQDYSPSDPFFYEILHRWQILPELHDRPVRYLVWMLDRDKFNFVPRTVSGRKLMAFDLDESFELQEIAGLSEPSKKVPGILRPAHLEVRSALDVARRMKGDGVTLPKDRQPPLHAFVKRQLDLSDPPEIEQELATLDALEQACTFELLTPGLVKRNQGTDNRKKLDKMHTDFEKTWSTSTKTPYGRILKALGLSKITCALERSIALQRSTKDYIVADDSVTGGFTIKHPSTGKTFDLDTITKLCEEQGDPRNSYSFYTAHTFIDNGLAIDRPTHQPHHNDVPTKSDSENARPDGADHELSGIEKSATSLQPLPPLLAWDNRTHEPLEVKPTDFYPHHPLALLSLTPRPLKNPPISRIPLVRKLVRQEAMPLRVALDRIAHGASDAIIPNCPSINDPLRGGRLPQNVGHLRIRLLTVQMWREVVEAWYAWPFRREDEEMEAETGTSSVFTDYDNGEI